MPLASLSLPAQSAPAAKNSGAVYSSRFDVATLYSYFGTSGKIQPAGIQYSSINLGAMGSGAYYFTNHVGIEAVYANHPSGANDGDSSLGGGIIYRWPMQKATLFVHGLGGGDRLGGPNTLGHTNVEPYTWGPSMRAGVGLDINMSRAVSLRLIQADYRYIHENFGTYTGTTGGNTNLSAIELSAGLVWHFGDITPPPAVSYSCSANPATVFPGDPVTVTGVALNLNPKKTATYSWTSSAGAVNGNSSTVTMSNKTPGSYTVNGHVTEGTRVGQSADCTASYRVRDFEPPTISCSANPSTVNPGDPSTIMASAVSPQNRPLTYSYNATAGSISSTTPMATLSTVGAAPGPITVTCGVADDTGKQATATTTVSVLAPPPPPPPVAVLPVTSSLCTTSFERDKARPVRVDNEAKACLDDVTLNLQQNPNAKLALVGTEDAKEARRSKGRMAAERAANTKDYLVTDKGIDPSRIVLYTGTADSQTVTTTLIPLGATLDTTDLTPVDESKVKVEGRKPIQ